MESVSLSAQPYSSSNGRHANLCCNRQSALWHDRLQYRTRPQQEHRLNSCRRVSTRPQRGCEHEVVPGSNKLPHSPYQSRRNFCVLVLVRCFDAAVFAAAATCAAASMAQPGSTRRNDLWWRASGLWRASMGASHHQSPRGRTRARQSGSVRSLAVPNVFEIVEAFSMGLHLTPFALRRLHSDAHTYRHGQRTRPSHGVRVRRARAAARGHARGNSRFPDGWCSHMQL